MKQQNVRVLLASEQPETRAVLRRIVEAENKAVIVAEAENGTRALTLARNLRPDVALIDSHLPYIAGLDNVPLSRIAGLEVAQSISEEAPDMRVVVLNSLTSSGPSGTMWRPAYDVLLCRESKETCIPFTLAELSDWAESPSVIFANVQPKEEALPEQKISLSDKALLAGTLGVAAGWLMILTMFLATIGVYVLAIGVTTALGGLIGKLASRIFHK